MRSMRRDKGIVVDTGKGVSGGAESEPKADASVVGWMPASVSGLLPVALSLAVSLCLSDEAPLMAVEPSMIDAAERASKGQNRRAGASRGTRHYHWPRRCIAFQPGALGIGWIGADSVECVWSV